MITYLKILRKLVKENIFFFVSFIIFSIFLFRTLSIDFYYSCVISISLFIFFLFKLKLGYSLSFKHLTVPSFFLLIYFSFLFLPSILAIEILTGDIKYWYGLSICSVFLTVPTGMLFYNSTHRHTSLKIKHYCLDKLKETRTDITFKYFFFISCGLILFSTLLYTQFADFIQLFEIIKAYPTKYDVLEFRFGAEKVPKLILGLFELSRRLLMPLCIMYLYTMSRVKKGKWKLLFYSLFPLALFISLLTLDRAPPVSIFGALAILAFILPSKRIIFKYLKVLTFVILAGLMGGLVSSVQYQSPVDIDSVIFKSKYVLSYRIAQDAAFTSAKTFAVYDNDSKFLGGQYIRMFSFLPGRTFRKSLENIDERGLRIIGPATFVGDLWRNWGFPAVLLGGMWVGFFYQYIQAKILHKKSITGTTVKIIIFIASIWIIWGNMFGIVTTGVMVLSVILGKLTQYRYKLS